MFSILAGDKKLSANLQIPDFGSSVLNTVFSFVILFPSVELMRDLPSLAVCRALT